MAICVVGVPKEEGDKWIRENGGIRVSINAYPKGRGAPVNWNHNMLFSNDPELNDKNYRGLSDFVETTMRLAPMRFLRKLGWSV